MLPNILLLFHLLPSDFHDSLNNALHGGGTKWIKIKCQYHKNKLIRTRHRVAKTNYREYKEWYNLWKEVSGVAGGSVNMAFTQTAPETTLYIWKI